jgi:hypothetical protein
VRLEIERSAGGAESVRLCADNDMRGKLGARERDAAVFRGTCCLDRESCSEVGGVSSLPEDAGPIAESGEGEVGNTELNDTGEKVRSGVHGEARGEAGEIEDCRSVREDCPSGRVSKDGLEPEKSRVSKGGSLRCEAMVLICILESVLCTGVGVPREDLLSFFSQPTFLALGCSLLAALGVSSASRAFHLLTGLILEKKERGDVDDGVPVTERAALGVAE